MSRAQRLAEFEGRVQAYLSVYPNAPRSEAESFVQHEIECEAAAMAILNERKRKRT